MVMGAVGLGSKGRHSRAGSQAGARNANFAGTVGSAADFERADEDINLD